MKLNEKFFNMLGNLKFIKADNEEFAPLEIKNDSLSEIQKQRIEKARSNKYQEGFILSILTRFDEMLDEFTNNTA